MGFDLPALCMRASWSDHAPLALWFMVPPLTMHTSWHARPHLGMGAGGALSAGLPTSKWRRRADTTASTSEKSPTATTAMFCGLHARMDTPGHFIACVLHCIAGLKYAT